MKLLIVHKLIINSVFLIVLSVGVVSWIFYTNATSLLVDNALQEITHEVNATGNSLRKTITEHNEDVLFLVNSFELKKIIKMNKETVSRINIEKQKLEREFESLIIRKNIYKKIRYINSGGYEVVSVSREQDKILRVRGNGLQDKSHREYVIKTLELKKGQIYLSEINLNREFGKIEEPYKQVIRIASPVFYEKTNKNAGMIIITIDIGDLLQEIQSRVNVITGRKIYITNDKGDYLLHPNKDMIYGFDIGERYLVQDKFPRLKKYFSLGDLTQHANLLPKKDNASKNIIHINKIYFDRSHSERFIAVIMSQNYKNIVAKSSSLLDEVVWWAILLVLFSIALSVLISVEISKPIKRMNNAINRFKGDSNSKINLPISSNDEIGELAHSFNSMVINVEKSQKELINLNEQLESRVLERTNDLNVALEKAELANAAKSEFLSRMSHELRTPLNAILGFSQILDLSSSSFSDIQRDNIQEILNAGHHLLALVNDVLDLSRIESGNLDIIMDKVTIDNILEQSIALIQPLAESRQIEIKNNIKGKGFVVEADSIRFKQVILNLLSNAIKYNCENGKVMLNYEIKEENYLRICVSDNGEGLTKENIDKLFTPFERLDALNKIDGVGIGLVITKYIVELMHGRIGVESSPGKGSTFWVELELAI